MMSNPAPVNNSNNNRYNNSGSKPQMLPSQGPLRFRPSSSSEITHEVNADDYHDNAYSESGASDLYAGPTGNPFGMHAVPRASMSMREQVAQAQAQLERAQQRAVEQEDDHHLAAQLAEIQAATARTTAQSEGRAGMYAHQRPQPQMSVPRPLVPAPQMPLPRMMVPQPQSSASAAPATSSISNIASQKDKDAEISKVAKAKVREETRRARTLNSQGEPSNWTADEVVRMTTGDSVGNRAINSASPYGGVLPTCIAGKGMCPTKIMLLLPKMTDDDTAIFNRMTPWVRKFVDIGALPAKNGRTPAALQASFCALRHGHVTMFKELLMYTCNTDFMKIMLSDPDDDTFRVLCAAVFVLPMDEIKNMATLIVRCKAQKENLAKVVAAAAKHAFEKRL